MLKETLNKGISTPIAIGIVLILVILVGGFTWLQYGEMWRETGELPEIELPEKEKVTTGDKEGEVVPSAVALNDEELINFLVKLDHELGLPEEIDPWFSKVIKEDLSGNDIEEIIVALFYGRPDGTLLRLMEKKNGDYQIKETQETKGEAYQIEVKDTPVRI